MSNDEETPINDFVTKQSKITTNRITKTIKNLNRFTTPKNEHTQEQQRVSKPVKRQSDRHIPQSQPNLK